MDLETLSPKELVALEVAATRKETLIYAAGVCQGLRLAAERMPGSSIEQAVDRLARVAASKEIGDMLLELAGIEQPQAELAALLEQKGAPDAAR